MNRDAIIAALSAYRIIRGSGVSEPLRAVDVQGIADVILGLGAEYDPPTLTVETVKAWKAKARNRFMISALDEYCPEEFDTLADAYIALAAAKEEG